MHRKEKMKKIQKKVKGFYHSCILDSRREKGRRKKMTDQTKIRVKKIIQRVEQKRKVREMQIRMTLTFFSLFCIGGIGILVEDLQIRGSSYVNGGYGTLLLKDGADGYIMIGVVAFTAGVILTVLCIRFRKARKNRRDPADEMEE